MHLHTNTTANYNNFAVQCFIIKPNITGESKQRHYIAKHCLTLDSNGLDCYTIENYNNMSFDYICILFIY